jgi:hypothetical protein
VGCGLFTSKRDEASRPTRVLYPVDVRAARASFVSTAVACVLAALTARADVHDECIAAAEQSQPLQHDGKLRAARERLRICTQPRCPALIRSDCTKWLADVEAATPTLVVHATDQGGADLADVRVLVDGELVASVLDGRDIPLDPGSHVVRLEHAGSAPLEERVVADVGVQHRMLSVTFASQAAAGPPAPSPTAPPPLYPPSSPPSADGGTHRSAVLPLLLGGVGVVAAAVGGVLWGRGLSECRSNLAGGAPSCSQDQLNGAHTSLVAGDVLVPVGAAIAVAGLVVWIAQGSGAPSSAVTGAMSGALFRF